MHAENYFTDSNDALDYMEKVEAETKSEWIITRVPEANGKITYVVEPRSRELGEYR